MSSENVKVLVMPLFLQVEALLDAFMKDTKLSYDEVIKALNDMNSKKDIREIFQVSECSTICEHISTDNKQYNGATDQLLQSENICSLSYNIL